MRRTLPESSPRFSASACWRVAGTVTTSEAAPPRPPANDVPMTKVTITATDYGFDAPATIAGGTVERGDFAPHVTKGMFTRPFSATDVDSFLEHYGVLASRTGAARVAPPGTLLGVARLAFPELMVELEATAVA